MAAAGNLAKKLHEEHEQALYRRRCVLRDLSRAPEHERNHYQEFLIRGGRLAAVSKNVGDPGDRQLLHEHRQLVWSS